MNAQTSVIPFLHPPPMRAPPPFFSVLQIFLFFWLVTKVLQLLPSSACLRSSILKTIYFSYFLTFIRGNLNWSIKGGTCWTPLLCYLLLYLPLHKGGCDISRTDTMTSTGRQTARLAPSTPSGRVGLHKVMFLLAWVLSTLPCNWQVSDLLPRVYHASAG
jgi:hypothetical protein